MQRLDEDHADQRVHRVAGTTRPAVASSSAISKEVPAGPEDGRERLSHVAGIRVRWPQETKSSLASAHEVLTHYGGYLV